VSHLQHRQESCCPPPSSDGKGQPSLTLYRYGVGVDCHSRFFQVCVLIPNGTEIVQIEQKVPAVWPEVRAAKARMLETVPEHGLDVSQSDLRDTCESTGQHHTPPFERDLGLFVGSTAKAVETDASD
jgi:hypothetical protein